VKTGQFIVGIILLIAIEVLKVYFIMPLPGSQRAETVNIAYFIHTNVVWLRLIGWLMIIYPVFYFFRFGKMKAKIAVGLLMIAYGVVFYMFNYELLADKMFLQPGQNVYASVEDNAVEKERLVLGINVNGEARAYPIQFIGYHHQVRDTIGGSPVMITYCTVCRTGRAFKPEVGGKPESFRLVGMDHFNAMFEDETTGSWWRQVNGEAIVGSLRGTSLPEIPSEQMTLESWIALYPSTTIMQADTVFNDIYERMIKYDKGRGSSDLTKRDSLSWKDKSWVVGVVIGKQARAYDWNDLLETRVINDTLAGTPIAVFLENDSASFRVFRRDLMVFSYDSSANMFIDKGTGSQWSLEGVSIGGALRGQKLAVLQSYQEFWHSWQTFRPTTTAYKPQD
jgi:hypothetical protein